MIPTGDALVAAARLTGTRSSDDGGSDMTTNLGRISSLWRFPVKSMAGEQLSEAALTSRGFVGDRAYALIDVESGKVVSAKSVKRFPGVLSCRATFWRRRKRVPMLRQCASCSPTENSRPATRPTATMF